MKKKVKLQKKEKKVNLASDIRLLIENSIALQKVLANMALGIDDLSKDVKKMVDLFTDANRAFEQGKRPVMDKTEKTEMRILQDKLNSLIEQNKVMANGIILLESYLRGKSREINKIQPIIKEDYEEEKIKKLPQYRF